MAKISNNTIPNLNEDWGLDSRNGYPYSGASVQEFIKKYLSLANIHESSKGAYLGYKDMSIYLFASQEDKQEWEANGTETWLDSVPLVIQGTDRKIKITTINNNNNPYFTTTQTSALVTVAFESLEKEITASEYTEIPEDALFTVLVDKGVTGSWTTIASDVLVKYKETYTVDLRNYLDIGANRVIFRATSASGNKGQLNITANLTTMYLTPANFAWNIPFIEGEKYNLGGMNIGGSLNKTLKIKVSNEKAYEKEYSVDLGANQWINSAYYFSDLVFPDQGTGVYNVAIWLEASGVKSDVLKYNIICVEAAHKDTAQQVAVSSAPSTVINYADNKLFEYVVYNGTYATASPSIKLTATVNKNPITEIEDILKDIPTSTINTFQYSIQISSSETDMQLVADLSLGNSSQKVVYAVDNTLSYPAYSNGLDFYMEASSRSNSQANRENIINVVDGEEIPGIWEYVSFVDGVDGHTVDDNGRKCLALPAYSKLTIEKPLLGYIDTDKGKTIEFAFKVKNIADYSEPIITLCTETGEEGKFIGIKVTPEKISLHSSVKHQELTQSIGYKDEEEIHVVITLINKYKVSYGNIAQIYVNGTKARSFEIGDARNFLTNANIVLGNTSSDLYVYFIRAYNTAFDKEKAEQNYIASLAKPEDKKAMYSLINSIKDGGNIIYDFVKHKYNTMVVQMLNGDNLPTKQGAGGNKEYSAYCIVEFNFLNLPDEYKVKAWNFILNKCFIEGQGTTSMEYWIWNLRFRLDKSDNLIVVYPDGTEEIII